MVKSRDERTPGVRTRMTPPPIRSKQDIDRSTALPRLPWLERAVSCLFTMAGDDVASDSRSGATSPQSGRAHTDARPEPFRLLLVEDDFLVGESMRVMLGELGCEVVGPAPTIEDAERFLAKHQVTAAILDITLGEASSAPFARVLDERKCPYVFVTGYANPVDLLPDDLMDRPRFQKPIDVRQLSDILDVLSQDS